MYQFWRSIVILLEDYFKLPECKCLKTTGEMSVYLGSTKRQLIETRCTDSSSVGI